MKIKATNIQKIAKSLRDVNKTAVAHTFSASQIHALNSKIKNHLSQWFSLKQMKGIKGVAVSGAAVSRSYDYARVATSVNFELNVKGELFITSIKTATIFQKGGETLFNFSSDERSLIASAATSDASTI